MTRSIFIQSRWEYRTQWSQRSRPVVLKWLTFSPALSWIFSHFRCPCNSFNPYSVHLFNATHTSQHRHFCHVQLLLMHFLRCPCLMLVHHCRSYNTLVHLSLDPQADVSITYNEPLTPSSNVSILTVLYGLSPHPSHHPLFNFSPCRLMSGSSSLLNLKYSDLFLLVFSPLSSIAYPNSSFRSHIFCYTT